MKLLITLALALLTQLTYAQNSCRGFFLGQSVNVVASGYPHAATITDLNCQDDLAMISDNGSLADGQIFRLSHLRAMVPNPQKCRSLSVGQPVYEVSTGTQKTARIASIDCRKNLIYVEFYGIWYGVYQADVNYLFPISE